MTYTTSLSKWVMAILLDSVVIAALLYTTLYQSPGLENVVVFFIGALSLVAVFGCIALLLNTDDRRIWTPDLCKRLAYSSAFIGYNIVTEVAVLVLLVYDDHPSLAVLRLFAGITGTVVIYAAREILTRHNSTP